MKKSGILLLSIGLICLFGTVVASKVLQLKEMEIFHQAYDRAYLYLLEYPLCVLCIFGAGLMIAGVVLLLINRKKSSRQ